MSARNARACALGAAALACACAVGPNYERPPVDTPASYAEEGAPGEPKLGTAWWTLFGDATLTELEEQAHAANQDLQLAMARVAEARASSRFSAGNFYPAVTLDPTFTAGRDSANGQSPNTPRHFTLYTVPFDLSYEVDLWGRVRRSFESATANEHAAEDDYGVVALTLSADIATRYFAVRSLDAQDDILRESVEVFADQVRVEDARYRAGIVSELDLAQAKTQLATAQGRQADVQRQRAENLHALAVLCGRPASDFALAPAPLDLVPPEIPAGVPSALLEKRPDVSEAEQRLVAANADIGVAEALLFPQVQLTGAAGLQSLDSGDLVQWESRVWALGPSISLPVFEGGRLRANTEGAEAHYDAQVAVYRQTVLDAFRDVEDALVAVRLRAQQSEAISEATSSSERAVSISRSQYDHGIVDYLQVIVAQSAHLDLELQAAQLDEAQLDAAVQLAKAIGGGWR